MFNITEVRICDCHLLVRVEHLNDDGSIWFREQYAWQGREGAKQKRATNSDGEVLMDDGNVAPKQAGDSGDYYYLPEGRDWALRSGPHMDDDSILSVIRASHERRQGGYVGYNGWDNAHFSFSDRDQAGCDTLLARFAGLVGNYE